MAKVTMRKTAKLGTPYATFENVRAGWTWQVLKVNQPGKSPFDPGEYATWFVAAKSPHTYGSWEYGDNYAHEILSNARLVDCTPEFLEYTRKFNAPARSPAGFRMVAN